MANSCSYLPPAKEKAILEYLLIHQSEIHVTDPDPTGTYLSKYIAEFGAESTNDLSCYFDSTFNIHRCYFTQQSTQSKAKRIFYFDLKSLSAPYEVSTMEICREENPTRTYQSPECSL